MHLIKEVIQMILFQNDPVKTLNLGSKFGPRIRNGNTFHNGIDIKVPSGTPIFAVADGEVVVSKVHPRGISAGMGIYIVVQTRWFLHGMWSFKEAWITSWNKGQSRTNNCLYGEYRR